MGNETRKHQMSISMSDFEKVSLAVGRIASVDDIPTARKPMYRLIVEFDEGESKQCVAGIKEFYSPEDLKGKLVVVVTNLEPKSVAGVLSECMILAAYNDTELAVLTPDRALAPGTKIR